MKRVSIRDVAKKAGVANSTVTNALNPNSKKVSSETRKKILKIVDELGYIPLKSAQNLSAKQEKRIGFFMRNSGSIETNFINHALIYNMNRVAQENDVELVNIITSENNKENYQEIYDKVSSYSLTDLVIHGLDKEPITLKKISELQINKIFIENPVVNEYTHFVSTDNFMAQQELIYEINKDKKINCCLYITGNTDAYVSLERKNGFVEAARNLGFEYDILNGSFETEATYDMLKVFDLSSYDVICCGNDLAALGLVRKLREENMTDVRVGGFDGSEILQYINWPMYTVKQDIYLLCTSIFEMIGEKEPKNMLINYEIKKYNEKK